MGQKRTPNQDRFGLGRAAIVGLNDIEAEQLAFSQIQSSFRSYEGQIPFKSSPEPELNHPDLTRKLEPPHLVTEEDLPIDRPLDQFSSSIVRADMMQALEAHLNV